MKIHEYNHTDENLILDVYSDYLNGYSDEDIFLRRKIDLEFIENIIECTNYLYV